MDQLTGAKGGQAGVARVARVQAGAEEAETVGEEGMEAVAGVEAPLGLHLSLALKCRLLPRPCLPSSLAGLLVVLHVLSC